GKRGARGRRVGPRPGAGRGGPGAGPRRPRPPPEPGAHAVLGEARPRAGIGGHARDEPLAAPRSPLAPGELEEQRLARHAVRRRALDGRDLGRRVGAEPRREPAQEPLAQLAAVARRGARARDRPALAADRPRALAHVHLPLRPGRAYSRGSRRVHRESHGRGARAPTQPAAGAKKRAAVIVSTCSRISAMRPSRKTTTKQYQFSYSA